MREKKEGVLLMTHLLPLERARRTALRFLMLALWAFSLFSRVMVSQEVETISTERPTVGDSPDVISAGSLQLENGAGVSLQKSSYAADLPENLLRLGLTKRTEVRFQSSDLVYQPGQDSGVPSLQSSDVAVSAKFLLGGPGTVQPKSAILGLSLPTGGVNLTSGSHDPTLTLIWTQAFPHGYFLNQLVQGTLTTLAGARRPVWAPSIAGGRSLTSTLGTFAEYAPSLLQDHSLTWVVDGGLTYTRIKTEQIDLRAGVLRDGLGTHTLISVGYSKRYDRLFGRESVVH
jgi:hypothetical protein